MDKLVLAKPGNDPYRERVCPEWFNDAKLGIFIHWGPYSVPGWAPIKKASLEMIAEAVIDEGYDIDSINQLFPIAPSLIPKLIKSGKIFKILRVMNSLKYNTYAEWYWNSILTMKDSKKYHNRVWGNKDYTEFGPEFDKESKKWNPDDWKNLFKEIGAKYVLVTAKHHDGYCLWPTKYKNPEVDNWNSTRDLIGDLKDSLDKDDIRLSLYYSAGYDWSIVRGPSSMREPVNKFFVHSKEGLEYFDNQMKEIIDSYRPGMFWHDIGYSKNGDFSVMLDHYYNQVPDGVVNDRGQPEMSGTASRHFDYTTTEYFVPRTPREIPWEICRGITASFGYNRDDSEETTLSVGALVESFADIISKNGNLMLGLGPKADGTIPKNQVKVVREFGQWINVNKEAIYGTRVFKRFDDKTLTGNAVRYTTKGGKINAIILGSVKGDIELENVKIKKGAAVNLPGEGPVRHNGRGGVVIDKKTNEHGCVLQFDIDDISRIRI